MADPKKKAKMDKFWARYKHYDPATEAPGSPEQWAAAAASAIDPGLLAHLAVLGLSAVPDTVAELRAARRQAQKTAHPDKAGGTHDQAALLNAAFTSLERLIPKVQVPVGDLPAPSNMLVTPARCTGSLPTILTDEPLTHAFTDRHVAEIKMNGEREMLYLGFCPYGRRQGNTMLSRQKSVHDGMFGDKTDHVPHITGTVHNLDNTMLDGEVFVDDWASTHSLMGGGAGRDASKATYYVWDMPFHKGRDIRQLPLWQRRQLLAEVVAELGNPYIVMLTQVPHDQIDAEFVRVTQSGGEGLVVKDINGTYGQGWAKYKKAADVSCFVIGFVAGKKALEGMVGSIELGVYKDGQVVSVGCCSGFDNALRTEITNNQSSWMGRVVDVFAFELTANEKLLNPTWHRERSDVNATDCTLDKVRDDLKKIKGNRNK